MTRNSFDSSTTAMDYWEAPPLITASCEKITLNEQLTSKIGSSKQKSKKKQRRKDNNFFTQKIRSAVEWNSSAIVENSSAIEGKSINLTENIDNSYVR